MTTNRRAFFATALSGAAALAGVALVRDELTHPLPSIPGPDLPLGDALRERGSERVEFTAQRLFLKVGDTFLVTFGDGTRQDFTVSEIRAAPYGHATYVGLSRHAWRNHVITREVLKEIQFQGYIGIQFQGYIGI